MKNILIIIFLFLVSFSHAQKVGLVLSGGGASGFAHIGVLKALEEKNIPIDYITGTSSGALIGALYASGYSPLQIEYLATSEKFYLMSQGIMEKEYEYYIHQFNETAELFSLRFAKDSIFQKSLPTNLLNPTVLDLELLNLLAGNPMASKKTFDSLFVPFRCVASDIVTKKSILFKDGDLNIAVRASMTYPFFISPIYVDGRLLFDGGLYNNFPSREMYNEFQADYIIGSNVSYNEPPPKDDDLMSQIKNMFSAHSNFSLPCEEGIIIEPELGMIGTFDFDKIKEAIQIGYETTLAKIDSIQMYVEKRISEKELFEKREIYKKKKNKINITDIKTEGVTPEEDYFYKKKLIKYKKDEVLDYDELKKRYLRLYQNEYILSIFPNIDYTSDTSQVLNLQIKKEKPLKAAFGGHFSSRPVNTGFLEVSYTDFKLNPLTIYANTYFGKFYGSVNTGFRFHLPSRTDSYIEPIYVMNRWDYFTSFSTFFEDVKPSFLVINERFWGIKFVLPVFNKGKLDINFKNGINEYNYYQTENFTNKDTADFSSLLFYTPGISYSRNSLNRKQFESKGSFFEFKTRFVHGIERAIPGSTAIDQDELDNTFRNWIFAKATFKNYFFSKGIYHLGVFAEGYYSSIPFFNNYTASVLMGEPFEPFPDSKTVFYNDFRANQYAAIGLINIFSINPKLDIRLEAYFFQPIQKMVNINGKAVYSDFNLVGFELASASVIYHTFIGPIRGSFNYYGNQEKPLSLQLSYGFVMFNEKSLK